MEQDNKEQGDEGSPLKAGSDDVGPKDQIVKVNFSKDCESQLSVLLLPSPGDRRDWSVAGGEKSDCLPGLHPRPGADISHSFLDPQD